MQVVMINSEFMQFAPPYIGCLACMYDVCGLVPRPSHDVCTSSDIHMYMYTVSICSIPHPTSYLCHGDITNPCHKV